MRTGAAAGWIVDVDGPMATGSRRLRSGPV